MPRSLRTLGLLLLGFSGLLAQSLTFEVASVKRSPAGAHTAFDVTNGGGMNATASLDFLILIAYKIKPFQLQGVPAWLRSEQYTIIATPPAEYVPKQPGKADDDLLERLRSLLVERFQLSVRRETREMTSYVLVVAKNGSKLSVPDPKEQFKLRLSRGRIANGGGARIAMLVSLLENRLERCVVDETGLTGLYKFNLTFAEETAADPSRPPENSAPSLFAALEEQAGLKLESKRRPVELVVIDRVERPSEN